MLNLRNISIRNKLIIIQVLTSVFVLAIFFTGFIVTDIKDYKQRKVKSIQSLARVLAANNISTLQFQDNEEAKKILTELRDVAPEINNATITDKTGKIFAVYKRNENDSATNTLHNKSFEFTENHLFVSSDIITGNNELIGKVYIDCELSELAEMKENKFGIAVTSLFVALAFGILFAIVIQTYISKRLLFLVNKMKEASQTNKYNITIKDDGKDEIGTLIKVYNELMQKVKESQQKKDEFIGNASHELKTPLTSIKGYIELLESMETGEPNKQFVQKASENIIKLEKLIKDLLDVSKINSGQLQLNISEFDIDELLDEAIGTIQVAMPTHHKLIKEGNLQDKMIRADRQRIEQVLTNLLSNAIKYSPSGANIIVHSYFSDSVITVRIKDSGNGIPEDDQAKIFERFYRSKNTSVHISGFGLGLYICKDIISRHNGKIWVESSKNGSSFYFSLPVNQNNNN